MPFFNPKEPGAGYFEPIEESLENFQRYFSSDQFSDAEFNNDNFLDKQIGVAISNLGNLRIICFRIEKDTFTSEKKLDVKSLYFFGKNFIESILFIGSGFFETNGQINWKKLGEFCKTSKSHLAAQPEKFRNFWKIAGGALEKMQNDFDYRNHTTHHKEYSNEWTFTWSKKNNLDSTQIIDVLNDKEEVATKTPREVISNLNTDICAVISCIHKIYGL